MNRKKGAHKHSEGNMVDISKEKFENKVISAFSLLPKFEVKSSHLKRPNQPLENKSNVG